MQIIKLLIRARRQSSYVLSIQEASRIDSLPSVAEKSGSVMACGP